jgi:hypothetical protein
MDTETVPVASKTDYSIQGEKAEEILKADKEIRRFHFSNPAVLFLTRNHLTPCLCRSSFPSSISI